MTWLLAWLFPLWALMPRARLLGSVSFQEVGGVGWMCTIRPKYDGPHKRGQVNCYSAQAKSLGASLRQAIAASNEQTGSGFWITSQKGPPVSANDDE